MTAICWTLALLFALLVLTPAPTYNLQQAPTATHQTAHGRRP